ncbi:MAG: nicotinate (nicotinamide) nucleotide adenylyltransferase [Candidatus Cloacimonadota bacterium]|nr:MAG: nicotinate (nicotinamide) nucleotide adenylyltransferase [Candidatus Cloacimonadota bacterium]PIE78967.1 MAG: nicotinate (nicotinamide) nucleotide adenylyltransferase [Candidatus Delongbacteria bacterium]
MLSRKKYGIYGGSFNPVHKGHILPLVELVNLSDLDAITYIPTYRSPHKKELHYIDQNLRVEMVKKAIKPYSFFEISLYEIEKGRSVFTYETVKYLSKQNRCNVLIIGYDSYLNFHLWKNYKDILRLVELYVINRPGFEGLNNNIDNSRVSFYNLKQYNISSTFIRENLSDIEKIKNLIPIEVFEILKSI